MTYHRKIAFAAAGVFVLVGLVVSTYKAKAYSERPYLYDNLYLPSGKFIKPAALGYRQFVADMVWLSAVQYYGGYRKEYHDLAYFEGLIDIVTDLDPHFVFPYRFGAVVIAEDLEEFDRAAQLLRKGMHHNPDSWELPFEIGFLAYVNARKPDIAARYFDLASRMPDSPPLTKRFAAFVYSKAGHQETSIKMWEEVAETAEEPYMRELAKNYIERLKREGSITPTGEADKR